MARGQRCILYKLKERWLEAGLPIQTDKNIIAKMKVVYMVAPDHIDEVLGACQGVMDGQTGQFEQTNDKKAAFVYEGAELRFR